MLNVFYDMKTIALSLVFLVSQTSFSQTLERIDVDEKISIEFSGQITRGVPGDAVVLSALTSTGYLTITTIVLPDSLGVDNGVVDVMKYFVDGYIGGMGGDESIQI